MSSFTSRPLYLAPHIYKNQTMTRTLENTRPPALPESGIFVWLTAHGRLWRVSTALIALLVALPIVLVLSA